jgi:hypothetical protein
MAWPPPSVLPDDPIVAASWRRAAEREEVAEWAEADRAERAERAERIERLKARVHEVDMRAAGALARDRWRRIEWRHVQINGRDERMTHVRPYGGYQVDSWGAKPEVEHRGGGWIVDVR